MPCQVAPTKRAEGKPSRNATTRVTWRGLSHARARNSDGERPAGLEAERDMGYGSHHPTTGEGRTIGAVLMVEGSPRWARSPQLWHPASWPPGAGPICSAGYMASNARSPAVVGPDRLRWVESIDAEVQLSVSTWRRPLPPAASLQRAALLDQVAAQILACGEGRLRVAVDGLTASGKTSFGHEIAQLILRSGRPVLRASLDDFKKPWRDRHRYDRESGAGYYRNAFDYPAVRGLLLEPAGVGGSGECVLCSIDPLTQIDHSAVITHVAPDAVLIVDGVFAFRPEINDCWDFRIWLEIDSELSVQRGTRRDQDWAGLEAEAVHRNRYLASGHLYIAEVDPIRLADVAIDNSRFDRPEVINK